MSALLCESASPDVRFRILREQDVDAASRIENSVYAFPWSEGNFRDSLLAGYRCWGCWHGDALIGYAILMLALDEAHLLNIAVEHPWQGRGVGRRLLQFMMTESRRHGCRMLYLEVRPSNRSALRLYDETGFRQLGVRPGYYPAMQGREDALFLGIDLA